MSPSIRSFRFVPFALGAWLWLAAATPAQANLDQLQQEALAMEKERDCEGAYKKYEEMQQQLRGGSKSRRQRTLLAFVATKLARLKGCYEKCNPTPEEKAELEKVNEYEGKGQNKRAYRILLRLLRGKNPRCTTWKAAIEKRNALAGKQPKRRYAKAGAVDPCAMEDGTRTSLSELRGRITSLEAKIVQLEKPLDMPQPPEPPKWAKRPSQKRWWLRKWRRNMLRKMRKKQGKHQVQRLQQILASYRQINQYREQLFNWRESFQDCDEVYTDLKKQSTSLRKTQDRAHEAIVGLYDARIKRIQGSMNWYARQYRKNKRDKNTDNSTIESLRQSLQDQRELLDNVTQDLVTLSTLLVFKPEKGQEGSLLNTSLTSMQKLMSNQGDLLKAMKDRYPQYTNSAQGRLALQRHISTLERFEKVLERFQGQQGGQKSEEVEKTLQAVRSSILLFEKAEESVAKAAKNGTIGGGVMQATATTNGGAPAQRSPWGWILLISGMLLGIGAFGYLLYERRKRPF
ncbi:MAG: hypothetical protein H6728_08700 [Myxococcales bacterium]|nr:hypothetical protein [Myxococcales bacterium]